MANAVNHPVHTALSEAYTKKCKHKITRQELDLSGIGFGDKIAYVLHNVLSPEECDALIKETESVGYTPALIHSGNSAVLARGYRDSMRVMIDDTQFAATLFKRIGPHLPQIFKPAMKGLQGEGRRLKEINERLRFLRYDVGDKFKAHYDGYYARPDGSAQTWVTLQLYLNEGMDGGETTFLKKYGREAENEMEVNRVPVAPRTGSVLVFQHDIFHEGSEVRGGRKYTIRMDVLYEWEDDCDSESGDDSMVNKFKKMCMVA